MDWIDMAQDRDQWREIVNTVMAGDSQAAAQLGLLTRGQVHGVSLGISGT
jgi:hypothetical protein